MFVFKKNKTGKKGGEKKKKNKKGRISVFLAPNFDSSLLGSFSRNIPLHTVTVTDANTKQKWCRGIFASM